MKTSWQEESLAACSAGLPDFGRTDEPLDNLHVPSDPVGIAFEKAADQKAGVPDDFVTPTPDGTDTLAKSATRIDPVLANRLGISTPFGSAATLRKRVENSNGWEYVYSADGEMVSGRQTDPDGGPLSKRAADERDLSKASSASGKIRFEKSMLSGDDGPEEWIFAYDHEGQCVRSCPAADWEQMHACEEAV